MADVLVVGLRALSFVAALQAAGVPLFLWLFERDLDRAARPIASLARRGAATALLLVAAHQVAAPARVTGSLDGIFDGSLHALLIASDAGTAAAVRAVGLALVLIAALRASRLGRLAGVAGGVLVATSFACMGHTVTHDQRWLLAGVLTLHLSIVAFWFGSLLPLYLVGKHEPVRVNGRIVERFSRIAAWLVPVIFIAGVVLSAALLPSVVALTRPYGRLLLAKVGIFALLMGLAALNKRRLGPAISRGDAAALRLLGASVRAEWALIAGTVGIAAAMTSLFAPAGE